MKTCKDCDESIIMDDGTTKCYLKRKIVEPTAEACEFFTDDDIDHTNTNNIICPYCGYEDIDSWESSVENEEIEQCNKCDKFYYVGAEISRTFYTAKNTDTCEQCTYYPQNLINRKKTFPGCDTGGYETVKEGHFCYFQENQIMPYQCWKYRKDHFVGMYGEAK